jgi:hypothetical protein
MDSSSFDDHAVDEDRGFKECTPAHVLFNDDKEFLGTTYGEDRDEDFAAPFKCAVDVVDELSFRVFP